MSNYVKSVNFASKDALASGNPSKLIRGTELNTEYDNIATAVATKEDSANKGIGNGYAGLDSGARLTKTTQQAATAYTDAANIFTSGQWINTAANAQLALGGSASDPYLRFIDNDAVTQAASIQSLDAGPLDIVNSRTNGNLRLNTNGTGVVQVNGTSVNSTALITSGTFADARIAASNVTQHQASLSIATSQLTGSLPDARVAQSNVTQHQAALTLATSQITSGTFADARIAASNVTQHQASLSIATSQLTGTLPDARVAQSNVTQHQAAIKGKNITGKNGTSFTIQSGGSASGGADGDLIGIY